MQDNIKRYNFKLGLKHEFEILDLDSRFKMSNHLMTVPHRAQFYHILWIEEGKGNHYIDFNPIRIEDQTIVFIPVNSVNQYDINGIYKGKGIIFTNNFFCKNDSDFSFLNNSILFSDLYPPAICNIPTNNNELNVLLKSMENEFLKEKDSSQYLILHNMLHIFLLQAERELIKQDIKELKQGPELNILQDFKMLLESSFQHKKAVGKYSLDLNITEKQLNKATTSLLGKSPKQLINERVLLEAKRLLVHSNLNIKSIAYQIGYDEPTNFIKFFKKHSHCTPSDFREEQRKQQ